MIARTEKTFGFRPRLVIACGDSARAALSSRQFRRLGWEVHLTPSGPEARRLVSVLRPQLVVLDVDLNDESGWLTCAKLKLEAPTASVALLTDEVTSEQVAFAEVVGATILIARDAALPQLADEVKSSVLTASN